ncbi:hypothetical protein [Cryptosporangium sp. NPDC051539]|uniref:hypothetical protein n=1 Tax=Cryptosporangium sp. NPDC051539 TaxID=3363962 RepID=UPI00379FA9A2
MSDSWTTFRRPGRYLSPAAERELLRMWAMRASAVRAGSRRHEVLAVVQDQHSTSDRPLVEMLARRT